MSSSNTFKLHLRGFASMPHLAERAFLKLAATTSDYNKQATADAVLTTAHHIEKQIREIMIKFKTVSEDEVKVQPGEEDPSLPISHWSKTSLTSTSYMQTLDDKKTRRCYTARIDFDVRFRNFAALGDLTARLSSLDHCEIESVDWRLMNATRKSFESRLRTEAAADALARARDYCAVFCPGLESIRITPVEILHENSVSPSNIYNNSSHSRKTHGMSASPDGLVFTPQECRMDLNVQVQFHVETTGFDMQLTQPQTVVVGRE